MKVRLHIQPIDFKKQKGFLDNCNCLIATAAKRQFKAENVEELLSQLVIDGTTWYHDYFGSLIFEKRLKTKKVFYLMLQDKI